MSHVYLKFDTTPDIKNKPYYFTSKDGEKSSKHLTFVQADLVLETLKAAGVQVIDRAIHCF